MSATDDRGLCVRCGGHGSTFHATTDANDPGLSRVGVRRIERGGEALVHDPCGLCDGGDRVTPMLEAQAEANTA